MKNHNGKIRNHKDLDAWKRSMSLVSKMYKITQTFPNSEIYGLINQIRRSAVSIPSNIAEGAGRANKKEFIQFLYISLGSLAELETQLLIASELGYTPNMSDILKDVEVIKKLINGLIYSLKNKI